MTEELLAALRAVVGPNPVLTEGDLSAFELDWRKRYRGTAGAVVRPGCTAEVAAVVRAIQAQRERHQHQTTNSRAQRCGR